MSSATAHTSLRPFSRVALGESARFRLKLLAHILFGLLVLLQSLYLVMCYITFDFFGALASPFFAWLRNDAAIAHLAYLPLLVGALLASDLGLSHLQKQHANTLIAGLLGTQLLAGLLSFFSHGTAGYFAWPLLFGPHNHSPGYAGDQVFWESFACLIPLGWICGIHISGALGREPREPLSRGTRLVPFLIAGMGSSLLYQTVARVRMTANGESFSSLALAFSLTATVTLFAALFLVVNSIRVISSRFPNPRVAQFLLHSLAAWLFMVAILRKIIFGLLAFSSRLADLYAMAFSLAVVMFGASIALHVRQRHRLTTAERVKDHAFGWTGRSLIFIAAIASFICSVELNALDWAHVLSSLAFVITAALLLCLCLMMFSRKSAMTVGLLGLLVICDIAGLVGIRKFLQHPDCAQVIEQYSTYDPSVFVVDTLFKPALRDESYVAWYKFLTDHASIRTPIEAPSVPLVTDLQPTKEHRPNIFVFVIDALRRDYVSAYNPRVTFTPRMQEFANDSVVFQNAYSAYAGTSLADPAIFSGFQQINKTYPSPLSRENNLHIMANTDGYDSYVSHNSVVAGLTAGVPGIKLMDTEEMGSIVKQLETAIQERKDSNRPIFVYTQPANVHTLYLTWHSGETEKKPHPGFDHTYASGVERVDSAFGDFIEFLKKQGLYDDSIILLTADHGESLGEMGRRSHVANVTPEVIRIPLVIHLPQRLKSAMVWNSEEVVRLRDIAPTLYYLVGHRPIKQDLMIGRPLFTLTAAEQKSPPVDHYLLMSSYEAVFGILSADQKKLFMTDAVLHRNAYYDLSTDPLALKNRATAQIVEQYQPVLKEDLENIDRFYGVPEHQLSH